MSALSERLIGIGVIGAGAVGGGVIRELQASGEASGLRLHRVAVNRPGAQREFDAPYTTDVHEVLGDPRIDVVIELMGGIEPATGYIYDAINSRKSVVTANKAVLAVSARTIFDAARSRGQDVGFEASVAGKIPIMRLLRHFQGERINSIVGILNGTSNFVLTKMIQENMSYAEALSLAQEKGFAEKDPSRDVDGDDAADKIVLLASIAHNTQFDRSKLRPTGIDIVTLEKMQDAGRSGYAIKPLTQAVLLENGAVEISVSPTLIESDNPLANVKYEHNGITISTRNGAPITIQGPGAGRDATTSAVMADVIRIADNLRRGTREDLPTLDGNIDMLTPERSKFIGKLS
jgi:homoserine dehydrogenase